MPILTDALLDEAYKNNFATSLYRVSRDRAAFKRFIEQVNSMWDASPQSLHKKIGGMIGSNSQGNYRGAIAELVSFWTLSTFFKDVNPEVNVDGKTPDFQTPDPKMIFETFCIGKDGGERLKDKYFADLQKDMTGFESVLKIHLKGAPKPNPKQNINGLGKKVCQYLNGLNPAKVGNDVHHVEHDGANVFFKVQVTDFKGPVVWGFVDNAASGNPQGEILKNELLEKTEKYPFPFVAIAVADLAVWGAVLTLLEPELKTYPDNLVGVIFISLGIEPPGGEIRLHLHMIEHPKSKGRLKTIFPDVPDVENPDYKGPIHLMPGLEMIPYPTGL